MEVCTIYMLYKREWKLNTCKLKSVVCKLEVGKQSQQQQQQKAFIAGEAFG